MSFSPAQEAFVYSKAPFPAFVGGFGSGKTAAAIARIMRLKRLCPGKDVAYYLPTYPLVEDIAFQRFPALFEKNNIAYKLNQQKSVIETDIGRILFRNMEQPDRIVGYEVAHSICDELDTLPIEKARNVWNKIVARNRQKAITASGKQMPNTVGVATTPEGFRFVYQMWGKDPRPGYEIIRARTMDNAANLPPEYIDNLKATYTENLLSAYLDGQFVNLTSGSVYAEFDRNLNASDETIREREPVHVGLDFNVGNVSATVAVLRGDTVHFVAEHLGVRDTPTMAALLKERYAGHHVTIYPDASGAATKSTNAALSDLVILRAAGFTVLANSRNPMVRDRVASVNAMIHNQGKRRLFVRPDTCPMLIEGLERQAYDKHGEPDKSSGFDHANDALGYLVTYKFPIHRGSVRLASVIGA